tara:strand:+ start:426 stop:1280 length:855 start_codon:yes stop_codon:yes gene_type:complete
MEKKYLYLSAGMLSILGIFTVLALATPFDSALGFHPLQQFTTDQTGTTSVDADENLIIDNSDRLGGFLSSSFCMSNGTNCPAGGSGGSWTVSGSNIYYDAGDVGIGMIPTRNLDVNGTSKGIILEGSNLIDQDDPAYYVDPSSVSVLNTLKVDVIELNGFTSTELSKLRFGGFYSNVGSTCNVPNPATGACNCSTGYTSTVFDAPIRMCWGSDESLPAANLVWGNAVYNGEVCSPIAFPPYNGWDQTGQPCSSVGDTNGFALSGSSCGVETIYYGQFMQTCEYQ